MPNEGEPPILSYRGPQSAPEPIVPGPLPPEWVSQRFLYRALITMLTCAVVFPVSLNLFRFGSLFSPTLADYVPDVEKDGVPVIKAMKAFERDNGRWPEDDTELVPKYLKASPTSKKYMIQAYGNRFTMIPWRGGKLTITYDFTSGQEGWNIENYFVNGRIPSPPVPPAPASQP